ncbi:MAG: YerC/YecD family TrpR-related protein [Eubacteriales bacterium]|jgi:TrpR-related protein YerC/YecD|nr:YerC/YecD family TrpR-related protein [Eubacteriales bacterium]MDD4717303.1 YerC/YecD family TrpR-related protein [Eubacteriales bacterium]
MNSKLKDPVNDAFFEAVLTLENLEDCYAFFEDVCTISEIKSLSQRFKVAQMLDQGRTYTEICDETKVSTATISRVNRALEYGADGYRMILDRMKNSLDRK